MEQESNPEVKEAPKTVMPPKPLDKPVQAPYPYEDIPTCIKIVKQIVAQKGTTNVATRNDIAVILGKSESTIIMKVSACVQYGLLVKARTKDGGYISSPLFQSYTEPVYAEDEKKHMLTMFQSPPLYSQIIQDLNGQILPNDAGFANLLKNKYKLNPNSVDRATKVFFDNARLLGLVDNNNRFRFLIPTASQTQTPINETKPPADQSQSSDNGNGNSNSKGKKVEPEEEDVNMIEVTIPMKNKLKAYLRFPEDYTNEDMDKIARIVQAYKEMVSS